MEVGENNGGLTALEYELGRSMIVSSKQVQSWANAAQEKETAPFTILVEGNIGSGKSSLLRLSKSPRASLTTVVICVQGTVAI